MHRRPPVPGGGQKKRPGERPPAFSSSEWVLLVLLTSFDVRGVQAFGALVELELDDFFGLQRLKSLFEDLAVVHEDVFFRSI